MARIYNPAKYANQYAPRAQSVGFVFEAAEDNTKKIKAQAAQDQANLRSMGQAIELQQRSELARLQASQAQTRAQTELLKGLVSLSSTAAKGIQDFQQIQQAEEKLREKTRNENLTLEAIGLGDDEGVVTVPDSEFADAKDIEAQVTAEAKGIAQVAKPLAESSDPVDQQVANSLQQSSVYRASYSGVKANVYAARAGHFTFLTEAINSIPDEQKPRTHAEATALIRDLNRHFLREAQLLDPAMRSEVASKLAPQMLENTRQFVSKLVTAGIKADQTNNLSRFQVDLTRAFSSPASPEEIWKLASEGAANRNIGFTGFSTGSNNKAMEMVLNTAIALKDDTFLAKLLETPKGPGLPKLGDEYGVQINAAIDKIRRARIQDHTLRQAEFKAEQGKAAQEFFDGGSREEYIDKLFTIPTPSARNEANRLSKMPDNFDQELENDLTRQAEQGNPPSLSVLKDALRERRISQTFYDKYAAKTPQVLAIKSLSKGVKTQRSFLDGEVLKNIDSKSEVSAVPSNLTNAQRRQLRGIQNTFAIELEQRLAAKLRNAPEVASDPVGLNNLIIEEAGELLKDRRFTLSISAKGEIKTLAPLSSQAPDLEFLSKLSISPGSAIQDFRLLRPSMLANRNIGIEVVDASEDFVLDKSQLKKDVKAIMAGKTDEVDYYTKEWAQALGMSPVELLNAQLGKYGLPNLDQMRQGFSSGSPKGDIRDSKEGFSYLKSLGIPTRGAAYLTTAISHESGWNGRRAWGEVAGDGSTRNGGLVSWSDQPGRNVFRLRAVEKYFGRPIAQVTEKEQVDYMLREMKRKYPAQYRTFMNPSASSQQLQQAVRRYWGFDPRFLGSRWTDAEKIIHGASRQSTVYSASQALEANP